MPPRRQRQSRSQEFARAVLCRTLLPPVAVEGRVWSRTTPRNAAPIHIKHTPGASDLKLMGRNGPPPCRRLGCPLGWQCHWEGILMASARGILADAVDGGTPILIKACSRLRLTYEIKLAQYLASQSGSSVWIDVRPECKFSDELKSFIAEHGVKVTRSGS